MKTILLFAFLSFASAIMVVPHDRNMTNLGTLEVNYTENIESIPLAHARVHTNADTHDDYSKYKHKPHLAVIENEKPKSSRKLLISISKLFRRSPPPRPAPRAAPAPAPRPAPRAAPRPAPAAAPKPAPRPAPKPAPRPAPKPAPKPAPRPAPKPAVRVVPKIAPKPTPLKNIVKNDVSLVKKTASIIVPALKSVAPKVKGIKIYGNYCGPNYCGGQKFKGAEGPNCRWGIQAKNSLDACCKIHDKCCSSSDTRSKQCNKEILSCVKNAKCSDAGCEIAKTAMKLTFTAIENKVCGSVLGSKKSTTGVTSNPSPKSVVKAATRSAPAPLIVVNKYSVVDSKLSAKTKKLAKKFESDFAKWVVTTEGQDAIKFCRSLGISNKQDIFNGCIEDMRVTKSKSIAEESALSTEEFLTKEAANPSKRYCVASGDPHVTNYDGELFHVQEPGIYTIARTPDAVFEIQEKMRKNGALKPGVPSCITNALVHYKQINIEVDVANYGKILVNGKEVDLPEDFTLTFGGVKVRYGKQVIEWKGTSMQPASLKVTTPNGFSVVISGGYCGVLETNVPTAFFGKMQGICGNADGVKDTKDYSNPNNAVMNVNRGAKNWEMGGYNGPNSPLSKWQLAWKPHGSECYFSKECENGVQTRKVIVVTKPTPPKPAVVTPSVRVTTTTTPAVIITPTASVRVISTQPKSEDKLSAKSSRSSRSSRSSSGSRGSRSSRSSSGSRGSRSSRSSSSSRGSRSACKPQVFPTTSHTTIKSQVDELSKDTQQKMDALFSKFNTMLNEMSTKQKQQLDGDKKILDSTEQKGNSVYDKYKKEFTATSRVLEKMSSLNTTLQKHLRTIREESDYLARLKIFKPKFLASLDNVKSHVSIIKNDVHSTIVEGGDKNSLLDLLNDVRSSTEKSAALLAKAFMDHYDKYNTQLQKDTENYHRDETTMDSLKVDYRVEKTKRDNSLAEYTDIVKIIKQLKDVRAISEKDEKLFSDLIQKVESVFKAQEKSAIKLSTANTQCAADVLKAHLAGNRV
jgi:hypothetical protein